MGPARLANFSLPRIAPPNVQPPLPPSIFELRLARLREAMDAAGLDTVVIYADREHSPNVAFVSGFDARFEESLLVVHSVGEPHLIVGNEGLSYAGVSPLNLNVGICQAFSLPGQDRTRQPNVTVALRNAGIAEGSRVGVVGWKDLQPSEVADASQSFDIPYFIIEGIRQILGTESLMVNFTSAFINPINGLRSTWEIEQLVNFEFETSLASDGLRAAIGGLTVGEREFDVASRFGYHGQPLPYHQIVNSGPRTNFLLSSPSDRRIQIGDRLFMANGGWGANSVRAGFVAESVLDLPDSDSGYLEAVVFPFASMVRAWYGAVAIGRAAGDVVSACLSAVGGAVSGSALNPGHLIHLEEWSHSPFFEGSQIELRPGMGIQMDLIPIVNGGQFISNMEDGIFLADTSLRLAIRNNYPEMWSRIQLRRDSLQHLLAIEISPDVMPLSNIQGWLTPWLLNPDLAVQFD